MPPQKQSRAPFDPGAPGPGARTAFERAARVVAPYTVRGREIVHETSNGRVVPPGIVSGAAPPIERAPAGAPGLVTGAGGGTHTPLTPGRRVGEDVGKRTTHTPLSRGFTPVGASAGPRLPAERARASTAPPPPPTASPSCGCKTHCGPGPATDVTRHRGAPKRNAREAHPASLPSADTMYSMLGGSGFRHDWADPDTIRQWVGLSETSYMQGLLGRASDVNPELERAAKADPTSPLASVYRLWSLSHLLRDWRFEEAAAYGEALLPHLHHVVVGGRSVADHVYTSLASAYESLGRADRAADTLRRRATRSSGPQGEESPWSELGLAEARLGRLDRAREAFLQAARTGATREQRAEALRHAQRLNLRVTWTAPEPDPIAERLAAALRTRDVDGLDALASGTHFGLGLVASEYLPCDRRLVLEQLAADLRNTRVRADPRALLGSGGKRYLVTRGWRGQVFRGSVWFILVRRYDGWEWGGVSLQHATPEFEAFYRRSRGGVQAQLDRFERTTRPLWMAPRERGPSLPGGSDDVLRPLDFGGTSRDAPTAPLGVRRLWPVSDHDSLIREMDRRLQLLAPWPAGDSFQAGGLSWFWGGGLVWIGDVPIPTVSARSDLLTFIILSAARECGLGAGGAYSQELWHEFGDAYAIDFVSYERGSLVVDDGFNGKNRSKGVSALAASEGCVVNLRSHVPEGEGDHRFENFVEQECFVDGQVTPYSTKYLHLDGPPRITVSVFQHVRQGYRFGVIDDTGSSSWDHLHFEVHDRRVNGDWDPTFAGGLGIGDTVRMTLEGIHLTPERAGHCITSSNVELVPTARAGRPLPVGPFAIGGTVIDRDTGFPRSPEIPNPDRQPKAYCYWWADQQSDPELAFEIRRACRALPDDPPLVQHRERRG